MPSNQKHKDTNADFGNSGSKQSWPILRHYENRNLEQLTWNYNYFVMSFNLNNKTLKKGSFYEWELNNDCFAEKQFLSSYGCKFFFRVIIIANNTTLF